MTAKSQLSLIDLNESLATRLQELAAGVSVAECHGFISAQVCVQKVPDPAIWEVCFLNAGPDAAAADASLADLNGLLTSMSQLTRSRFEAEDLSFELLLPADDTELEVRSRALVDWCRGFLSGLGHSGVVAADLGAESRELLQDIDQISHAAVVGGDEAEEFALLELIEYVRIGALSIYHEMQLQRQNAAADTPGSTTDTQTLH